MLQPSPAERPRLAALHRAPEPEVLSPLLPLARLSGAEAGRVRERTAGLVAHLRREGGEPWVEQFLQA
jgi:hypothetical protein